MRLTAEELIDLATIVRSKPTIANKYDGAATRLAAHVFESIESRDERRARFEKWYLDCGWWGLYLERYPNGEYEHESTRHMWLAFNAALDFGGGGDA